MDWVQATTAILGALVGGFIGASIGRATERDKGIREEMIAQATALTALMQNAVAVIERGHREAHPPAADLDDQGTRSDDGDPQQLFERLLAAVAVMHLLFHRQIAWKAEAIAKHLRKAWRTADTQDAPVPNLAEVRRDMAVFTEWAGADIRRPSGSWRWERWARRRFRKHEARVIRDFRP